jgi:hypothetical protein
MKPLIVQFSWYGLERKICMSNAKWCLISFHNSARL